MTKLTRTDSVEGGDLISIFSQRAQEFRGATTAVLLEFLNKNLTFPTRKKTYYEQPEEAGFVTRAPEQDAFLVIMPSTILASGTVTLNPQPADGEEINIVSRNTITALTIDAGDKQTVGAPTTLNATRFVTLRYEGVTGTWWRVG